MTREVSKEAHAGQAWTGREVEMGRQIGKEQDTGTHTYRDNYSTFYEVVILMKL